MRDIQVSRIPYVWRHCELRSGMFGMGFMGSGGSLGESGYLITIPGAVITGGGPGVFNETTGTSGTIATATTDLPDLGSGFQWGIYAGSDARIGVVSTATGQGNTMGITTSSAIYSGDSANFTVTVTNGVKMLGFPFTATGTQYSSEASALFARITADPGTTRKNLINNLIVSLKTAGVWTKLDVLYLFAAADSQSALLNWVSSSYNCTATNSPTFTANQGYTGNGTNAHLATGFNPSSAAGRVFAQDSSHLGVYTLSTGTGVLNVLEAGSTTLSANWGINSFRSDLGNVIRAELSGTAFSNSTAVASPKGHNAIARSSSSQVRIYRDGALLATNSDTSTSPTNTNLAWLRYGTTYSARQIAAGHMGSSLSDAEMAAMNTALSTYLTAVGAI